MSLTILLVTMGLAGCGDDDPITPAEVNASAPASEISSPGRAAFLQAGTTDDMNITVEGEVCDSVNQITNVVLNGTAATLTGSGNCRSFSAELNSTWGLNVLEGLIVTDLGHEVALVQSYLRSGEFLAPPPGPRPMSLEAGAVTGIPNAFRARLGQDAIDDGDRSDPDDLVSVINMALRNELPSITALLNTLIPNTIYSNVRTNTHECLLQTRHNRQGVVFRTDGLVTIGGIQLNEMTTADDEIVVEFGVGTITAPLFAAGYQDNACVGELSSSGTGSVGIRASSIRATLSVDSAGDLQVELVDLTLGDVFIDIELDGLVGWFDGLISAALTFLGNEFVSIMEPALGDIMRSELAPLLADFIGMNVFMAGALAEPILDVTVMVETETDLVEVREGFIEYGVSANAYPTVYAKTPEELAAGTIVGANTLPAFDGMNGSFGLGLKHDFINQVFWAYWAGGGFDYEDATDATIESLNDEIPAEGVTITSMEMTLPPVLMPGDTEAEVKVGAGGIVLTVNLEQSSPSITAGQPVITRNVLLTVHVAIFYPVTLGLSPDRGIAFNVSNEAEIDVQIVDAVRTNEILALEAMFAGATEKVLEALIKDVGISIMLPELPLGPATWYLADGVMDQASGYVRIIGSVGVRE